MMYYSIIPWENISVDYDDFNPKYKTIYIGGVEVQILCKGGDRYEIVRIHSSDPQVYLNPNLQPGLNIELNFLAK